MADTNLIVPVFKFPLLHIFYRDRSKFKSWTTLDRNCMTSTSVPSQCTYTWIFSSGWDYRFEVNTTFVFRSSYVFESVALATDFVNKKLVYKKIT